MQCKFCVYAKVRKMALKACPLVIILDINVVIKPIFAYIQFLKKLTNLVYIKN